MFSSRKVNGSHSKSPSPKHAIPDSIHNKGFLYKSSINKHRNLRQISSAQHHISRSIGDNPAYVLSSMINKVEIMVDEYQKVRNIESRSSKRVSTKQHNQQPHISKSPSNFSIIEQLSRKLKADKAPINTSYLTSSRFKDTRESFEKIGPGSYRVSLSGAIKSPSYRFPSAPRLDNSFEHKLAGK